MRIVALIGASGSGKSTVEAEIERLGYKRIISYTTREMRPGEENNVDYHFVSKEQFQSLIDNNVLLEHTEYNGNMYGAPKPVGAQRYVVVVEENGLDAFKSRYGSQVFSVLLDVAYDTALHRMANARGTEAAVDRLYNDREFYNGSKFADRIRNKVDYVADASKKPFDVALDILVKAMAK